MEKSVNNEIVEIVAKNNQGVLLFELKDPKMVNRNINSELKATKPSLSANAVVVYPDNYFIDIPRIFVEDTQIVP